MNPIDKPREQALSILRSAEQGTFVDEQLDRVREQFDRRDSAFILELVNGTLRNRALLDWKLDHVSRRPVEKTDTATRNILRLGAYQLLFLDRVPASAAVDTSTELAKAYGKKQGYVNGVLRNLDRKRDGLASPSGDTVRRLSVLYSHPAWLVRRWVHRYGEERAAALLAENNRPAPLVVRTNTLRTTRDALKTALAVEGVEASETKYSPQGLLVHSPHGLRSLKAYQQGLFIVQDEAAQLISMMLSPMPGARVLDACAAPGGKTTHLAELMENRGKVVALESDAGRMGRIRENAERLGTSIIVPVLGDAGKPRQEGFDSMLIDAPCSGLGVLRRHPDGRWNKHENMIGERAALQRRILDNCSGLLRPGGSLVYATCTTEQEENEDVILSFLGREGAFAIDDPRTYLPGTAALFVDERGFFRTWPAAAGMDGFFGVRLVKKR